MTDRSDVRPEAARPGDVRPRDVPAPEVPSGDPWIDEAPPATDRLDPRARTVIAVLLVSAFVVILNETIMSVALPVLMADLGVTASVGQWLTAGFLLTMSVVIPITGFLIRRFPTRMLFGAAMGLFSTGTLLAALAPGFPVLLAARVVQAGGTAIMLPLLMTTVMTLVPPARRGVMMGNISIVISVAPAIGPAVSGLVLSVLGWRFLFWLVLPIALVTLVLGLRRITDVGETAVMRIDALVRRAVRPRLRWPGLRAEQRGAGRRGGAVDVGGVRRRGAGHRRVRPSPARPAAYGQRPARPAHAPVPDLHHGLGRHDDHVRPAARHGRPAADLHAERAGLDAAGHRACSCCPAAC